MGRRGRALLMQWRLWDVSRRTGCATCRDNCPSSFIGLDARQLPHEANMIAFAAFVQQGVAIECEPIAGGTNELNGQAGSRIADCRQLALSLPFHAGLCDDGS